MDWFFDEWLYKMGHPIFEVTQNYDDAKKQLTLGVKQTQQVDPTNEFPQVDFFQTNVEIEIDNKIEKVWIKPQAENTFTFNVAGKPKLVNFDYQSTLIKELKFDKSVDELLYQMQNDQDVLGRNWAMGQLQAKAQGADSDRIKKALLNMAENDKFWHLRQAALGAYRERLVPEDAKDAVKLDDATIQALQRIAKDKEAVIRAAAISHHQTGLTIGAHTGPAVAAFEQLSILEKAGVHPPAWIWIHAQNEQDPSQHVRAARRGAWVSFDGLGPDSVTRHVKLVTRMRDEGLLHRVLVSQDAGWYHVGEPLGGSFRPFDTVFTSFIPAMRAARFTDGDIHTLFVNNPANAFSIAVRRTRP